METFTTNDFMISPARQLTMSEIAFFYVTNQPTAFNNLDRDLDPLLASLEQAKVQAGIAQFAPGITRYYKVDSTQAGSQELYVMEVGIQVQPGTQPAGAAQVKTLPAFPCAAMLLWGSLVAHIAQTYETLMQAMKDTGLKHTGEVREWNYNFEGVDSPNNIIGIYLGT